MIIYLASYPRSGNNWSVNLIKHFFNIRTTTIYRSKTDSMNYDPNLGKEQPLFYDYDGNISNKLRFRRLIDNSKDILTDELRKNLAKDNQWYFIKTHEFPFSNYFSGENILHIVRNPAAVFWSYKNFISCEGQRENILDIIMGNNIYGDWGRH